MRTESKFLRIAIAALFCLSLSLATALMLRGSAAADRIPYVFIAVVAFAAARWSSIGAILGLLGTVLLFATLMYAPLGSVAVQSSAARLNLAMMVALGLASSYLFARTPMRH